MKTTNYAILREGEESTHEAQQLKLYMYIRMQNDEFLIMTGGNWVEQPSTAFDFVEIPAHLDTDNIFFQDKLTEILSQKFDDYEVNPIKIIGHTGETAEYDQCEPEEAEVWSVYGHIPQEGLQCLIDCKDELTANTLAEYLTLLNPIANNAQ